MSFLWLEFDCGTTLFHACAIFNEGGVFKCKNVQKIVMFIRHGKLTCSRLGRLYKSGRWIEEVDLSSFAYIFWQFKIIS